MSSPSESESTVGSIKVGVIGCGRVGQERHLPTVASLPGVELVAVCDVDAATRQRVSERYGVTETYEHYEKLVASESIDAVMVCAPTQYHAEAGIAALNAGKHVMIEKPLALSLEEVDKLQEAATTAHKIVAVAMNSRWHRLSRGAREIVRAGSLGELGLLRSAFTDDFRLNEDPRPWMMKHELAGCVLIEQAVHHYDLWRFLMDTEVVDIYARMQAPETHGERAAVTATMSNGVVCSSMFTEGLKPFNELEIFGREGHMRLSMYDFDGLDVTPRTEYPGTMGPRIRRLKQSLLAFPGAFQRRKSGGDWLGSYRNEWQHFIDCIRTGKQPESGLEEGRRALQVGLAAMASLRTGAAVRIDDAPTDIQAL